MIIHVGSTNRAKVEAVEEILKEYPHLAQAEVRGVAVESVVSAQPLSLDETIRGAMHRGEVAYPGANYGIGLESGLMEVPHTKSGYMDVCACAIYDGTTFHLGLSSGWEFPDPRIMKMMLEDGLDMSEAINAVGLTQSETIGMEEGAIGILTKGRIDRKEYTKQALSMALIHLDPLE